MLMIVTKSFRPKGSGSPQTKVGAEIEATAQQAVLWKALKLAQEAPPKPVEPPKPRTYMQRAVQSETAPAAKTAAKRTYIRRDLTAEKPSDE